MQARSGSGRASHDPCSARRGAVGTHSFARNRTWAFATVEPVPPQTLATTGLADAIERGTPPATAGLFQLIAVGGDGPRPGDLPRSSASD